MSVDEVYQAVRGSGHGALGSVRAAILEPNGSVSVIASSDVMSAEILDGVVGAEHLLRGPQAGPSSHEGTGHEGNRPAGHRGPGRRRDRVPPELPTTG